jgi:hypothetical protein
MGQQEIQQMHHENLNRLLLTVASQTLLICAVLVLFFSYLRLSLEIASGFALTLLLGGSLLCWRNFFAARAMLILSMIGIEVAILAYEPDLAVPAVLLNLVVAAIIFSPGRFHE